MKENFNIDLRSDTVTLPSPQMRQIIADAPVGDDVMKEDPTVNTLEDYVAQITGHEAALFLPTATQSNLVSLLSHCQRGDGVIVGKEAHLYKYERGGISALAGLWPMSYSFQENGIFDLNEIENHFLPIDPHFAPLKLICLENTHHGKVLNHQDLNSFHKYRLKRNLKAHLDGARLFNAAAYNGETIKEVSSHFDSVTLCLSKGLGCPAGAVLAGNNDFIRKAMFWRKAVGGSMRQSGLLAAAGLHVLENCLDNPKAKVYEQLRKDHLLAKQLYNGLNQLKNQNLLSEQCVLTQNTNMVFVDIKKEKFSSKQLQEFLEENNIKILTGYVDNIRLVVHQNINPSQIEFFIQCLGKFLKNLT